MAQCVLLRNDCCKTPLHSLTRGMKHLALATRVKSDFDALSSRFQDAARWMIDHPADVALLTPASRLAAPAYRQQR
jgi:hypothetical protein